MNDDIHEQLRRKRVEAEVMANILLHVPHREFMRACAAANERPDIASLYINRNMTPPTPGGPDGAEGAEP